jgi:site-specific DNA-methyltransferase (adenine-specific)
MRVVDLEKTYIPDNRQRKVFDQKKLDDLEASILSKGLLHPPVYEWDEDYDSYRLVAGERRTRAIQQIAQKGLSYRCDGKDIAPGKIPLILITDLSSYLIREAELEENIIRENLTWQEQAAAIAELHQLRTEQAEEMGTRPQTVSATATEIKGSGAPAEGKQITKVTEAIILARHLDDPEVAAAKSQKDAVKILRKKAEAAHREKLAAQFDHSSSPHILTQGDSLELLRSLPDSHFDLILTDPPYGVGADTFGDMASTGHAYKDTPDYALACYTTLAREGARVGKPTCTLLAFCDIRMFSQIEMEFTLHGWDVWPSPLIWNKLNGMLPKPDFGPRKTYEAILMATRGSPRYLKTGAPDVLTFAQVQNPSHGAQKPVDLYVELITRAVLPGARVLDPFAGSGTIFPASNRAKVTATGFELNHEYYNLALSRINEQTVEDLGI